MLIKFLKSGTGDPKLAAAYVTGEQDHQGDVECDWWQHQGSRLIDRFYCVNIGAQRLCLGQSLCPFSVCKVSF